MDTANLQHYIEYLFRAALKKCQNLSDAEDLTQEVLLAALQYPKEIANLKSWLSTVLNYKYYDLLRKKYKLPTISIDVMTEMEEPPLKCTQADWRPDAEAVRREVAYLADKYRTVIVRHYLYGEKVQDIADSLHVPKGTVLSRLASGREQLKKGLDEMQSYEKQSYSPERLDISCHGCMGFHDEPWSLVANDLMKQNILIISYSKPLTVTEIAKAIGIPTAYVETAVRDLVKSELMHQSENKYKYFTDFMIVTPADLLKRLDAELAFAKNHYDKLSAIVHAYLSDMRLANVTNRLTGTALKKLEYYFVLHLFSSAIYTAIQRILPSKEEYPKRPDGGNWIAVGTKYPADFDYGKFEFGKYCYAGERRTHLEHFLSAKSVTLHVYDTQPDLNKYEHGPIGLHDDTLAKLLYIIAKGIPPYAVGFDVMFLEDIPHLAKCGVLGNRDGVPFVDIPMLTPKEYEALDKIRSHQAHVMADMLEPLLREIFPQLKIEIPKHLTGRVAEFRQYSCYSVPMAFIKEAAGRKEFDFTDAVPPMVFVVDET